MAAAVLTMNAGGLCAVTASWVPAERCVRCGRPTRCRFHGPGTQRLFPVHAECLRQARLELADAA